MNCTQPVLRIVECKASRKEATYQTVQVAIYQKLVQQLLDEKPVTISESSLDVEQLECVVARIDDTTNTIQDILLLMPLDVSRELVDIDKLLAENGKLDRITKINLPDIAFQIEPQCDSCIFNIHCLSESARERKVEIIGVNSSVARTLKANGIYTIDDLATLDPDSQTAHTLRNDNSFTVRIETLIAKAKARRKNLPGGANAGKDDYEVDSYDHRVESQLPSYDQNGDALVRVYMSVTLDYVEKRVVALAAHITKSDHKVETETIFNDGRPENNPIIREVDTDGNIHAVSGEFIEYSIPKKWTNNYVTDSAYEESLLHTFLESLYKAIRKVAAVGDGRAPIHFYFWSRQELRNLMEACARSTDAKLLWHLQQLMGSRESLEQSIYSCLQDEVKKRYALGWTGLGLSVVTYLKWYGKRYHWTRLVDGEVIQLDKMFTQDIFDFKTDLWLDKNGNWAEANSETTTDEHRQRGDNKYKFEIRSRFNDGLTPPYFYAFWDALPPDSELKGEAKRIARRYKGAKDHLAAYLEARVFALRWIEERVTFKNTEIEKASLLINDLRKFDLQVNDVARAATDYLRLDHHVKLTDWFAGNSEPPIDRVAEGRSLPLQQVTINSDGSVSAVLDANRYGISIVSMLERAPSFAVGGFVRLSRCSENPQVGQTRKQLLFGKTCTIDSIDENTGFVQLSVIPYQSSTPDRYVLNSSAAENTYDFATLDVGVSDFTAGKVESRLLSTLQSPAFQWFTPLSTQIAIPEKVVNVDFTQLDQFLSSFVMPNGFSLSKDQQMAIMEGIGAKIQLLQGPPGTGKSTTTSISILSRITTGINENSLIIIAANTHQATNTLLEKIDQDVDNFNQQALAAGLKPKSISLVKIHSKNVDSVNSVGGNVEDLVADRLNVSNMKRLIDGKIAIIGGTVPSIHKALRSLYTPQKFRSLKAKLLVVDEASMMVFPHFLSLATFVADDGDIMLAGDHRQLSPIIAHDWESEDRPPVMLYKPYVSAYQAIWDIRQQVEKHIITEKSLIVSQLTHTFRLPSEVVKLISKLYKKDGIELQGRPTRQLPIDWSSLAIATWPRVWYPCEGVFLITHNERLSKKSNEIEVQIIERIMKASTNLGDGSTAIVTPHRAQRALLKKRLESYNNVIDVIETVEKLQGGERNNIIVSATASDSAAINSYTDFILNLNRANVAFSRPKERLIVVCSEELLNYIPADSEQYETAMLWKELRNHCSTLIATEQMAEGIDNKYVINIYTSI
ncbi:AAA domain-containing protein [Spirosoma spitsbergense]|uniref:AAA domain-containing protein n=1 Tax=Spirosoma spitsbergense TaxID=431554 RepID=UPI00037CD1B2|nr:AAA domain-containing protein [Spirosoma spitsbergense]